MTHNSLLLSKFAIPGEFALVILPKKSSVYAHWFTRGFDLHTRILLYKQLLDDVFVISRIINVINLSLWRATHVIFWMFFYKANSCRFVSGFEFVTGQEHLRKTVTSIFQ